MGQVLRSPATPKKATEKSSKQARVAAEEAANVGSIKEPQDSTGRPREQPHCAQRWAKNYLVGLADQAPGKG